MTRRIGEFRIIHQTSTSRLVEETMSSRKYYMKLYPTTTEHLDEIMATLRTLYPVLEPRRGYTDDQHRVSIAFHEGVIDDLEAEVLHEYLDSGRNMLEATDGKLLSFDERQ